MPRGIWNVHKFGGSCLADKGRIENAARVMAIDDDAWCAVVVSAMGGVTDQLIRAAELAARQSSESLDVPSASPHVQ